MRHAVGRQSRGRGRTRLTLMQFYGYSLMRRPDASILPHAAGRLFQQYCVDTYTKMGAQRLWWVRTNQAKLRVEEYKVLRDWTESTETGPVSSQSGGQPRVGRPVVLPSSFSGSTRAMQMNYHDAMALVRQFGKPEYLYYIYGKSYKTRNR